MLLPYHPLLSRLLFFARRENQLAITDEKCGIKANYLQLVRDVVILRARILDNLTPGLREKLETGQEVAIVINAEPGYAFVVATLAVVFAGAIAVPIC